MIDIRSARYGYTLFMIGFCCACQTQTLTFPDPWGIGDRYPVLKGHVVLAADYVNVSERISKDSQFALTSRGISLQVEIIGEGMPTNYHISPSGWVDMPYVRRIQVLGRTTDEIAEEISKKLQGFIKNSKVKVTVTGPPPIGSLRGFTVGTSVIIVDRDRKEFIGKSPHTLVEVLSARALPEDRSWRRIAVIRLSGPGVSGEPLVILCDLWDYYYYADLVQDIVLRQDDIIFVPLAMKGEAVSLDTDRAIRQPEWEILSRFVSGQIKRNVLLDELQRIHAN